MPANPAIAWHSLAFSCAFVLLVVLGWQGTRTQEALLATNRSVSQSLEIITSVQAILSSLQDIETGARGFILTADDHYLEPYERGLGQLERHRRALQTQLMGRDYPSQSWFETLDSTIAERLRVAASNIRLRRAAGLEATIEQAKRAGGNQLTQQLRALLNAVEQHERRHLMDANRAVAHNTQRSQQLALIGSLIVAALFLVAFWAIQRSLLIRQRLLTRAQADEARLSALLQAIPDPLYTVDARQQVSTLSQGSTKGGPAPAVIEPLLLELLASRKNGQLCQLLWCELQSRRIFEVRLMPTGLGDHLAIARDVSELERSRDSLREQKVLLRRVVDTDENLIFVTDEDGCFLLCNSALAAVLGLQPEDIEQRCPTDLPIARLLEPVLRGERDLHGGNAEARTSEVALTDVEGRERWLQVIQRPLPISARVSHVVTVAMDISQRRRMEQMKSEFISTVSHELRTPLTAIRGALGMLVNGTAGAVHDAAQPLLGIAHKNSERLVRLINDILDMEKLEAGRLRFNLRTAAVRPLLQQALSDLAPYSREYGVSLVLEPAELRPCDATLDPDRFAQVMANLLSNAIKHSPRGATVRVDMRPAGELLEIGVRDQGAGVPDDFRARIFERFAQADASDARQRGGTGLGLAISRALVEQMHGQIGFDSEPGSGTRFWFRLPRQTEAPRRMLAQPDAGPRILILEPQGPLAGQLAEALHQQGYATVIAQSVSEAHELLDSFDIQALTLSPALAEEGSVSFLHDLRSQHRYRQLPVLIVGLQPQRREEDDGALRGGAVGVVDWLQEPVELSRVVQLIRACLPLEGTRPRVLHVEDDDDLRTLLAERIAALNVELHGAATLEQARRLIGAMRFDLVIIDLMLPDGDGSALFDQLAQSVPAPPVILFSALDTPVRDSRLALRQLVKSRHDGDQLAQMIQQLLQQWPRPQRSDTEEVQA